MAQPTADPPSLRVLPIAGDDGRDWEELYRLWAYVHGRNATQTATAAGLPARTVQHRARVDGWHQRADKEAAELTADARAGAKAMLYDAVASAVATLAKIARGEGETRTVLDKDGKAVQVTDPVPAQARVNASTAILDRVGLAGASKTIVEAEPYRHPEDEDADRELAAFLALSPEERIRVHRERSIRRGESNGQRAS